MMTMRFCAFAPGKPCGKARGEAHSPSLHIAAHPDRFHQGRAQFPQLVENIERGLPGSLGSWRNCRRAAASVRLSSHSRPAPTAGRIAEFGKDLLDRNIRAGFIKGPVGPDQIGFVFGDEVRIFQGGALSGRQPGKHLEHFLELAVRQLMQPLQFFLALRQIRLVFIASVSTIACSSRRLRRSSLPEPRGHRVRFGSAWFKILKSSFAFNIFSGSFRNRAYFRDRLPGEKPVSHLSAAQYSVGNEPVRPEEYTMEPRLRWRFECKWFDCISN